MLRDHQNNTHSTRLEWIVIILIFVEVRDMSMDYMQSVERKCHCVGVVPSCTHLRILVQQVHALARPAKVLFHHRRCFLQSANCTATYALAPVFAPPSWSSASLSCSACLGGSTREGRQVSDLDLSL